MTLLDIVVAMVPVAALFIGFAWLQYGRPNRPAVLVSLTETLVLTLFAALWFGSIGAGAWWLVFTLLGALVSGAERGLRSAFLRSPATAELKSLLLGIVRYVLAGGLLAWRLS